MSYIDSINDTHIIGGANTIINCTTSASTATKTATTDMCFDPTDGLSFKIKFKTPVTTSKPTIEQRIIIFFALVLSLILCSFFILIPPIKT